MKRKNIIKREHMTNYSNAIINKKLGEITKQLEEMKKQIDALDHSSVSDKTINTLLTEYETLRDELKQNFNIQIRLFGMIVTALGVAYGLIIEFEVYPLILLVPFILLPLGLRIQHSNYGVKIIGEYLEKWLEPQIKDEINGQWKGYQTFWKNRHEEKIVKIYDGRAKLLLFGIVPFGIAALYSAFAVFPEEWYNILPVLWFNIPLLNIILTAINIGFAIGIYFKVKNINKLDDAKKEEFENTFIHQQCKTELNSEKKKCYKCGNEISDENQQNLGKKIKVN